MGEAAFLKAFPMPPILLNESLFSAGNLGESHFLLSIIERLVDCKPRGLWEPLYLGELVNHSLTVMRC